jgi:tetratricopeptide (TPR) repeat protein
MVTLEATQWQSRALFVSSTFEDMNAERDHLQQFVFPELQERLRAQRTHLAYVDLRWGVETSDLSDRKAKEATVLKVCLSEIDRCRPYFIVLLGERYGWVPPHARVEAAAEEVSLALEDKSLSVTALEIEYGVLRTEAPVKPFFYFRQPLPCDRMPQQEVSRYSDRIEDPDSFQRVEKLKARVRARYPDRVREYSLNWDSDWNRPSDLTDFGKQVLEDLWSEFQNDLAKQPEIANWRGEESYLLDAFIEDHTQVFIERGDVVAQIVAATSFDPESSSIPGIAIVADSGAGKSALFATVIQKLAQANEALVLAHSAGISSRSISVSNMLQRWCALLAAFLEVEDESEKRNGPDELKSYFLSLLLAASSRRKVVLLIDALDQFERTSQAMYMTWLPPAEEWPRNVALIATTTPGTEYGVLSTKGLRTLELQALSEKESSAIAARICANFHKSLPPTVLGALLEKRCSDGRRAAGNPLWLTLAVNELILLDEDDFAQLSQLPGTSEQRLVQLMAHVVGVIPPEVPGAYDYLYAHLERTYGEAFVRSLMIFLAIARFGLRESDLQALTPATSGVAWLPSSLAAVRRALRAQLSERGGNGQWAFTHLQAQAAAVNRYAATPETATPYHCDLARHLMSLPSCDPLREETMFHLLCGGAKKEAGAYWIEAENDVELPAAFTILRQRLLSSDHPGDTVSFVLSFLAASFDQPDQDAALVIGYMAWQRLLRFTEESRLGQADPKILRDLLNGIIDYMRKRLRDHPRSAFEETVLYRALQNLGQLETEQRELDAALLALHEAAEINDRHAAGRKRDFERTPKSDEQARYAAELFYHENERDRMLNFQRIAQLHIAKNERDSARTSYEQALEIARYFLQVYPESELAAADMAMNLYSLADLALEGARFEPAAEHYAEGLKLVLAAAEKQPTPRLEALAIAGHLGVARANARLFRLPEAIQHYASAVKGLRESAQQDPGDLSLQWRFLRANDEAADLFGLIHMRNGIEGAMQCYDNGLNTCLTMLGTGVRTPPLFQHLHRCYEQKAVIAEILGSFPLAQTFSNHAREVVGWQQQPDAEASPGLESASSA